MQCQNLFSNLDISFVFKEEQKLWFTHNVSVLHYLVFCRQAVVFVKRTLRDQLFHLELLRRPLAVEQYLAFLRAHFNLHDYEHMLQ